MQKKIVISIVLGVSLTIAIFILLSLFQKKEAVVYTKSHIWHVEVDDSGDADLLVRGNKIGDIKNDVNKLILALNESLEESAGGKSPRIRLKKIEKMTARIEIMNHEYLTEKMGSSGAQDYLASVTYTLTESPGIKAVDLIFQAGEHAIPGVYRRENFADYTIVPDEGRKGR